MIVVWRIQILFVLFSVFMFCASALAQEGMWSTPWVSNVRCNRQDADKAEYEALKTWATVYSAFKRYASFVNRLQSLFTVENSAVCGGFLACANRLLWTWDVSPPALRPLHVLEINPPLLVRWNARPAVRASRVQ